MTSSLGIGAKPDGSSKEATLFNKALQMLFAPNGAVPSADAASATRELPSFEDHSAQEKHHTTCYMCACRCGIEVTVEDNRVRFIRGNPDHPINKGVLSRMLHRVGQQHPDARLGGDDAAQSWKLAIY